MERKEINTAMSFKEIKKMKCDGWILKESLVDCKNWIFKYCFERLL